MKNFLIVQCVDFNALLFRSEMQLLVTRVMLVLDCSCGSVPATLGHLRMLVSGEGSTGTKRGASKKYRTRQELQDENVYVLC